MEKNRYIIFAAVLIVPLIFLGSLYLRKPVEQSRLSNNQTLPSQNSVSQPASPASAPQSSSGIVLLSPNGGTLTKGETYTITWAATENFKAQYPEVTITLISGEAGQAVTPDQPIPHIVPNNGSYLWKIPNEQFSGWVQDASGNYQKVILNDQTKYKLRLEALESYRSLRGPSGPLDYNDQPIYIISP